ncbi:protein zer-1 homolog isoform X2 [Lasioglossum baleicum]|uniref:protein zer-1 homolog isoform X2 n=1 Tax=Lasioglossum baleicum TaxID=434251 RepID=UPI003FCED1B8
MADLCDFFRVDLFVGSETLTELCFKVICKNLDIISVKEERKKEDNDTESPNVISGKEKWLKEDSVRNLSKGLILPSEICDRLIEYVIRSQTINWHDEFFHIFRDMSRTKLKRVKIVRSNLTDRSTKYLTCHKLVELELIDCPLVEPYVIDYINANGENLQSLTLRRLSDSFSTSIPQEYKQQGMFNLPNLRSLDLEVGRYHDYINYHLLLSGLPKLMHLDLSYNTIDCFQFLSFFPNLISLVLYNVRIDSSAKDFIQNLSHLKNLSHLDISQSDNTHKVFTNPNDLHNIVTSLPQLSSLDISGTNLAGVHKVDNGVQNVKQTSLCELDNTSDNKLCDIPGLVSRVNRPLQFLGLYATSDGACRLRNIPAKLIAGDANEDQILAAANVCMNNKVDLLLKVLNDLYHVYRYENFHRMDQGLCVILDAMEKHPDEKYIQISGSATLFYVVKMKEKDEIETRVKERIVRILLTGMSIYNDEEIMMRNGCLTLSQFRIPQDVMSNYETLVKLLIHSAEHSQQEGYVQRIAIFLLNSLACQVTGREKRLLGSLGCIKTMFELIRYRVTFNICDDVLEVAWSTMWNMTDETPINCERFLNEDGMSLFHECIKKYRHREELLKNMMGLFGNIAEVPHLRVHLTQQQYISLFASLLHTDCEVIEISYNAAGILAHIASDGIEAWTVTSPSRDEVLELMVQAIEQWDIRTGRNINYRSFEPLLRLLDVYHTPQCQHWSVWALANLTNVYPHKYCKLLVKEGGPEKLTALMSDSRPYKRIRELAAYVYENVMCYTQK